MKKFKLSDQALGAVMMALQKSLLEQSDIVPVLKDFDMAVTEGDQLLVMNPPIYKVDKDSEVYESVVEATGVEPSGIVKVPISKEELVGE
mgnify:CR=1 FL=1|tara:strand:- start:3122 stop:3391 length:270 start_codon:yes stop_codon:yes gene_type:complete